MNEYAHPDTGETYCLRHLLPYEERFTLTVDNKEIEVPLRIHFANHCYTKSRDDEPAHLVIFSEQRRGGVIDERVFCPNRWQFSQRLPQIITDLPLKACLRGGQGREIFYRQEQPQKGNPHSGWYLCIRLNASDKYKNLNMSVRSIHWRENRPIDTRRGPMKFKALLAEFYTKERAQREWL